MHMIRRIFLSQGEALLRDLLSAEVITTLNEALCQNHKRICPPSAQLLRVCGQARCDMLCLPHSALPSLPPDGLGFAHMKSFPSCPLTWSIDVQAREMFDAVRLARRRVLEAARADNCTDLEVYNLHMSKRAIYFCACAAVLISSSFLLLSG